MAQKPGCAVLRFLTLVSLLVTLACVTPVPSGELGVQPGHVGFVPAQVAVLGCRPWPQSARFASIPLTNAPETVVESICGGLEKAVLEAFADQPFMSGFAPPLVAKLLKRAKRSDHLRKLDQLWRHRASDCNECQDVVAFYHESIAPRVDWRVWLNELSLSTRNTDAALMPFVLYAHERRYEDRGLEVAERTAGVAVLLVDTNNAELLWAGASFATLPNQQVPEAVTGEEPLPYPPWEDLHPRLFTPSLWRDYPGRQLFR